ncbi:unnamed protein product [Cyprideis torosa]|uniref:Uncharacterized protein n=1 Tax=Cyprideis torosa TaxID=163714 RepID=A0A7R8W526_9CRUS|nr:unnamed protein product [Cyprideis torosa]CAG0882451.1 unnamed protein product [Cyprideis torosa]
MHSQPAEFLEQVLPNLALQISSNMALFTKAEGRIVGSWMSKIVTSDRLVFTRVDRKLMGAYLCIASNGVPPIVSKRIQLDVEFPPKVETKEPQVTVKAGVEVHLTCVVESHPKSMHYWMRNQTIVIDRQKWKYETQEIHQYYRATLTLKIKNVDKEDSGTYTCVSRNSLGEDEANLRVTVSGSSVAPVANAAWTETGTEEDRNSADTCLNSELLFMMLLICLGVSTSSEFLENPWR